MATLLADGTRDRSVHWYSNEIKVDIAPAGQLLEEYSGIPAEEVEAHIRAVVCVLLPFRNYD